MCGAHTPLVSGDIARAGVVAGSSDAGRAAAGMPAGRAAVGRAEAACRVGQQGAAVFVVEGWLPCEQVLSYRCFKC
jgi:hypothetical protein